MSSILAYGENIDDLIILDDAPVHVAAIRGVADGGFVLAGSIATTRKGWVAKINKNRTLAWKYHRDLSESELIGLQNRKVYPRFNDIVEMPDRTLFACGMLPQPFKSNLSTALLSHIDDKGKLINEQIIQIANPASGEQPFSFDRCIRWGDGFAITAHEQHNQIGDSIQTNLIATYVLLKFDAVGKLEWQKKFTDLSEKFVLDPRGFGFRKTNDGAIFLSTNNKETVIYSFDNDGKLLAKKLLKGVFSIIESSSNDTLNTFFESSGTAGTGNSLIAFDLMLNEKGKILIKSDNRIFARKVFKLPNGSAVMFGSQAKSTGSISSVQYVHRDERNTSPIVFNHKFEDEGIIHAAAFDGKDKFSFAGTYAKNDGENAGTVSQKFGAYVRFFEVQPRGN